MMVAAHGEKSAHGPNGTVDSGFQVERTLENEWCGWQAGSVSVCMNIDS